MFDIVPITEFKKSFSHYVRQAEQGGTVVISRYGKKVVALIAFDEYKRLSNQPIFGLAGLVGTIEDGDELAQILEKHNRTN